MPIGCVLFDMDGVIFQGRNFWLDLHRRMGTERLGIDLAKRYLDLDYDELARLVVGELWKGRSAAAYQQLVRERIYEPGIKGLVRGLQDRRIKTAIITSGPLPLALRAQRELGFDEVHGNDPVVEAGRFTGRTIVGVPNAHKLEVGRRVLDGMGLGFEQAAYVGDSANDVEICRVVALGIAYDTKSPELESVADICLRRGELPRVLDLVDHYSPAARSAATGRSLVR